MISELPKPVEKSRPRTEPPPVHNGNGAARRLLIVDDNELTCKQLQRVLQTDASLAIEYRTDPAKALTALEETNYSILLTDLRMPKLTGLDLIREIQERRLPVTIIVTTGHGSIGEAVQAILAGSLRFPDEAGGHRLSAAGAGPGPARAGPGR